MEDEGNRQVSQKLKALEQSQKQLTTIIIGGVHDDGSHNPKCLMGLRPGHDAWTLLLRRCEYHGQVVGVRSCAVVGGDGIDDELNKTSPAPTHRFI